MTKQQRRKKAGMDRMLNAEDRAKAQEALDKRETGGDRAAEARAKAQEYLEKRDGEERAEARAKAQEYLENRDAEKRAEARVYVVKSGDSLSKIAKELYGDASRWPEIFEANKDEIKDPA